MLYVYVYVYVYVCVYTVYIYIHIFIFFKYIFNNIQKMAKNILVENISIKIYFQTYFSKKKKMFFYIMKYI